GFAAAKSLARALQQAQQPGKSALRDWRARPREIDLGGLAVGIVGDGNRLSNYLDIALFGKGGKLVF
ncbi:MAG: amino acid-binding protein, partial [Burkholderiaceae bacterium]